MKFKVNLDKYEYSELRRRSMRGLYSGKYDRVGDVVTFYTGKPKDLAKFLETFVDFGETTAYEVLTG